MERYGNNEMVPSLAASRRRTDNEGDESLEASVIGQPSSSSLRQRSIYEDRTPGDAFHRSTNMRRHALTPLKWLFSGSRRDSSPVGARPGSYVTALDGLRGLCCLIVFNHHSSINWSYGWMHPLTSISEASLWQLPYIRLLWLGDTAVPIFFVISGFVLSRKFWREAIEHQDSPLDTLFSAVARRAPRLYLPTLTSVFLMALLIYMGLFEIDRTNFAAGNNKWRMFEPAPARFDSMKDQLRDVLGACWQVFHFWSLDLRQPAGMYNPHAWSIHAEMTVSMLLFAAMLVTHRLRPTAIMIIFCVIGLVASYARLFPIFAFFAGASTALWETCQRKETALLILDEKQLHAQDSHGMSFKMGLFVTLLGGYLASAPIGANATDVLYRHVYLLFPSQEGVQDQGVYLRNIGSILIVWSALYWKPATTFFSRRFATFMGQISFSFYLIHGPVIRLIFHSVLPIIYEAFGDGQTRPDSNVMRLLCWVLGLVTCLPLTIFLAGIFNRYVDVPTLKLCRKIKVRCVAPWQRKIELQSPAIV